MGRRAWASRRRRIAFAAHLLGDRGRVERRAHPDLYLLEPLGDQIRIDEIRRLRRDLHMRPFEADRRVYLLVSAHLLNDEAADALLKDLEEPPPYAVMVLLADELGPLPETIRSRCQLVPFSRLSEKAVHTVLAAQAPGLPADRVTALARVAGGRLDRAERLLDDDAAARREELLALARGVYADPSFEPSVGGRVRRPDGGHGRQDGPGGGRGGGRVARSAGPRARATPAARRVRRRRARACWRRWRSSPRGTATSWWWQSAPRPSSRTSTTSTALREDGSVERLPGAEAGRRDRARVVAVVRGAEPPAAPGAGSALRPTPP